MEYTILFTPDFVKVEYIIQLLPEGEVNSGEYNIIPPIFITNGTYYS